MAKSKWRRCQRCRRWFVPKRPNHRYCDTCYSDTAPMGQTSSRQRPGGAGRIHGGISRVRAGRPVAIRRDIDTPPHQPSESTIVIMNGLQDFLSKLYDSSVGVRAFLRRAGLDFAELQRLWHGQTLDSWIMRFCPKFREWLIENVGIKAASFLIESYGLYGEPKRGLARIASELDINNAPGYREWAFKQLCQDGALAGLEEIGASTGRSVLRMRRGTDADSED